MKSIATVGNRTKMNKPIAVCISDIHFNLNNLELATTALQAAISKATDLNVPMIIAGDLHDTKAIIRGEIANRLLSIFQSSKCTTYLIIGNHDLLNEKGFGHSLNFLAPYVTLIDKVTSLDAQNLWLLPYFSNADDLITLLPMIPLASTLIMHQGFMGASMGDYVVDKSSIDPVLVKEFRVISGHYHRHQSIGTVTYIGSPYTMTFGEANDGHKGFLVLHEDGSFHREILNLRKHIIAECNIEDLDQLKLEINPNDLVWLKITGSRSELEKLDKKIVGDKIIGHANFKWDLIPKESETIQVPERQTMSNEELFDSLIDAEDESDEYKAYLKALWREIV